MSQTEKIRKAIAARKNPPAPPEPVQEPKAKPVATTEPKPEPIQRPAKVNTRPIISGKGPSKPIHREFYERLPDGARFDVKYNAAEIRWYGMLEVSGQTFTDDSKAVFKLLAKLDEKYRDWKSEQPKSVVTG